MSQFIRFTSDKADAVFLCGDMNLEPVDVGYKIICANTGLKDAWIHKVMKNPFYSDISFTIVITFDFLHFNSRLLKNSEFS